MEEKVQMELETKKLMNKKEKYKLNINQTLDNNNK